MADKITSAQCQITELVAFTAQLEIVDSHPVDDGFWSVFVRARRP